MKRKQILTVLLTICTLLGSGVSVHAEGLSSEGDTATAQTGVSFTVTEENNVIVSVPESLTFVYDDSNLSYSANDTVSAYGLISKKYCVEVTAASSIRFKNQTNQDAPQLRGTVSFGDVDNTGRWSSAELKSGKLNADQAKKINLDCNLTDIDDLERGTYNGTLTFNIKVARDMDNVFYKDTDDAVVIGDKTFAYTTEPFRLNVYDELSSGTTDSTKTWREDVNNTTLVVPSKEKLNAKRYASLEDILSGFNASHVSTIVLPAGITELYNINSPANKSFGFSFTKGDYYHFDSVTTIYVPDIALCSDMFYSCYPNLKDFYYGGTALQFEDACLKKDRDNYDARYTNNSLWNATIHVLDENNNWVEFDKAGFLRDNPKA